MKNFIRFILVFCTLLLVLATVAATLADRWWIFDLAANLRVQYVALGLLLLLLCAYTRSIPTALALAAVIAVNAVIIAPMWRGDTSTAAIKSVAASSTAAASELRVATINVQWGNQTRSAVTNYIKETRPDILVLQEAVLDWDAELPKIGAMYSYISPKDWRQGARLMLFSQYPIQQMNIFCPAQPESRFAAMLVKIDTPDGAFYVVGVHAPYPVREQLSHARNKYMQNIGKFVASINGPVMVVGDFNSTSWSPHFRQMMEEAGLRSTTLQEGWMPTWPSWFAPAGMQIDHILVNDAFNVNAVSRGPQVGSDHFPLFADLRLDPNRVGQGSFKADPAVFLATDTTQPCDIYLRRRVRQTSTSTD